MYLILTNMFTFALVVVGTILKTKNLVEFCTTFVIDKIKKKLILICKIGEYSEYFSIVIFSDYQAKKLQILMKQNKNEYKYAHTINGTACATTRIIMALMENGQQENGTVKLPECLHKYMGDTHLRKNNFEMEYVGLKQPKRFQKRPK